MARRKRRQFTPEFRADAVRLTQVGDRSIAKVAEVEAIVEKRGFAISRSAG